QPDHPPAPDAGVGPPGRAARRGDRLGRPLPPVPGPPADPATVARTPPLLHAVVRSPLPGDRGETGPPGGPPVRVLVAGYFTHPVGGVEVYLRDVIPRLRARGIDAGLLTLAPGDPVSGGLVTAEVPRVSGEGLSAGELIARVADWGPD